jgi:Prealbumin-like fold domain
MRIAKGAGERWRRSRRAVGAALAVSLLAVPLVLSVTSASATVGTAASFEDADANLAPNGGTPNFDWNSFAAARNWRGTAPTRQMTATISGWNFLGLEDYQATTSDSGFSGGTKQDANCAGVITAKADNKADLKRVYLASKTVLGHTYLMLSWERIQQNTTSPSAHVAFEFNQGTTACGAGHDGLVLRSTANGGDMLVVYDFLGGSTLRPTIGLSRWIGSGTCQVSSDKAPCWGLQSSLSASQAEAAVDTGVSPFPSSAQDTVAPVTETIGTNEFGEAGIDLTAAGVFTAGTCHTFGKAFGVSRTSGNSGTAQMKDLVGPGNFTLSNCGTLNITKLGSDGGPQTGAVFTLYNGSTVTGTVVGLCTVLANGACSPSFGLLVPGTYTVDETSLPLSGSYLKDPSLPFTFLLATGQVKLLTFTDPALPGAIAISKTDDAGNAVLGAVFKVRKGSITGTVLGLCTTDALGACTILGLAAGSYSLDETSVPLGYAKDPSLPKNVSVTSGHTTTVLLSDPRLFKAIVIVCQQSNHHLYPSTVSIDSDNTITSTISTTQALAIESGLQAKLCGITQGAKSGLKAAPLTPNPHTGSITIPHTQ